MARVCDVCNKGGMQATKWQKLMGQYNPVRRTVQKPNLQKTRLPDGRRVRACTECMSALTKGKIDPATI